MHLGGLPKLLSFLIESLKEPLMSLPGSVAALLEGHISQCLVPNHCHEEFLDCVTALQNSLAAHTLRVVLTVLCSAALTSFIHKTERKRSLFPKSPEI